MSAKGDSAIDPGRHNDSNRCQFITNMHEELRIVESCQAVQSTKVLFIFHDAKSDLQCSYDFGLTERLSGIGHGMAVVTVDEPGARSMESHFS